MFPNGVVDQSRVRIRALVSPPPKAQTRRLEVMSLAMFLRTKRKRRTLPVLTGSIDLDGTGRLQPAAAPRWRRHKAISVPIEYPCRLETIPHPAQARALLQAIEDPT